MARLAPPAVHRLSAVLLAGRRRHAAAAVVLSVRVLVGVRRRLQRLGGIIVAPVRVVVERQKFVRSDHFAAVPLRRRLHFPRTLRCALAVRDFLPLLGRRRLMRLPIARLRRLYQHQLTLFHAAAEVVAAEALLRRRGRLLLPSAAFRYLRAAAARGQRLVGVLLVGAADLELLQQQQLPLAPHAHHRLRVSLDRLIEGLALLRI